MAAHSRGKCLRLINRAGDLNPRRAGALKNQTAGASPPSHKVYRMLRGPKPRPSRACLVSCTRKSACSLSRVQPFLASAARAAIVARTHQSSSSSIACAEAPIDCSIASIDSFF